MSNVILHCHIDGLEEIIVADEAMPGSINGQIRKNRNGFRQWRQELNELLVTHRHLLRRKAVADFHDYVTSNKALGYSKTRKLAAKAMDALK